MAGFFAGSIAVLIALLMTWQWYMLWQAKHAVGHVAPDTSTVDGPVENSIMVYFFYSPSCGPCRQVKPVVEKLQAMHDNLISINSVEHQELSRDFGIAAVPSFIVVNDGLISEVKLGRVSELWLVQRLTD